MKTLPKLLLATAFAAAALPSSAQASTLPIIISGTVKPDSSLPAGSPMQLSLMPRENNPINQSTESGRVQYFLNGALTLNGKTYTGLAELNFFDQRSFQMIPGTIGEPEAGEELIFVYDEIIAFFHPDDRSDINFANMQITGDTNFLTFDNEPKYADLGNQLTSRFSSAFYSGFYYNGTNGPGDGTISSVIPEPGSASLALVGIGALALRRRRDPNTSPSPEF